jgi:hypothetical protein
MWAATVSANWNEWLRVNASKWMETYFRMPVFPRPLQEHIFGEEVHRHSGAQTFEETPGSEGTPYLVPLDRRRSNHASNFSIPTIPWTFVRRWRIECREFPVNAVVRHVEEYNPSRIDCEWLLL